MITRRLFTGCMVAAGIGPKLRRIGNNAEPHWKWITIAAAGRNQAGRVYGPKQMAVLERDIRPGMKITRWSEADETYSDDVIGVVTDARRNGDLFQIRDRWFRNCEPAEPSWITLHGSAIINGESFELVEIRNLEVTSGGSTFDQAERAA